jgi:hypothetical protein
MQIYLDIKSPYSYSHTSDIKALYENVITREHMHALWNKIGLDFGDILSSYQYEPHIKLADLMRRSLGDKAEEEINKTAVAEFDTKLELIKKA